MRALSLTRPWPEIILRCGKRVENRTWTTPYRGPLLLHAAQSWQGNAIDLAEEINRGLVDYGQPSLPVSEVSRRADQHPTGIVGIAELIGICHARPGRDPAPVGHGCRCGPWAFGGQHHWQLADVRSIGDPIPCRGKQGLWEPPPLVFTAVCTRLGRAA